MPRQWQVPRLPGIGAMTGSVHSQAVRRERRGRAPLEGTGAPVERLLTRRPRARREGRNVHVSLSIRRSAIWSVRLIMALILRSLLTLRFTGSAANEGMVAPAVRLLVRLMPRQGTGLSLSTSVRLGMTLMLMRMLRLSLMLHLAGNGIVAVAARRPLAVGQARGFRFANLPADWRCLRVSLAFTSWLECQWVQFQSDGGFIGPVRRCGFSGCHTDNYSVVTQ